MAAGQGNGAFNRANEALRCSEGTLTRAHQRLKLWKISGRARSAIYIHYHVPPARRTMTVPQRDTDPPGTSYSFPLSPVQASTAGGRTRGIGVSWIILPFFTGTRIKRTSPRHTGTCQIRSVAVCVSHIDRSSDCTDTSVEGTGAGITFHRQLVFEKTVKSRQILRSPATSWLKDPGIDKEHDRLNRYHPVTRQKSRCPLRQRNAG